MLLIFNSTFFTNSEGKISKASAILKIKLVSEQKLKYKEMKIIIFTCTVFLLSVFLLKAQVRIAMEKNGGVYTTPCTVNGLQLRFVFDTGASNVSISLSEAVFMLKNGYLDEEDLHGSSYSQIANGELVENTTINIKELEIGGIRLQNIEAIVIHELSAPLLLGQSAIQRLGPIQIEDDELIIMNADSPTSAKDDCLNAINLVIKAKEYYFDNLDALASNTYQKAYNLCPNAFSCYDIYLMGSSFYYIEDYENAIKFLEKTNECKPDNTNALDFIINSKLGSSNMRLEKYQEAELYYEKALSIASNDNDRYNIYFDLGYLYSDMGKYQKAIDYYDKSLNYYTSYKNIDLEVAIRRKIKNKVMGAILYNIGVNYIKLNQILNAERYMLSAKFLGYGAAIDYCRTHYINFELKN
jgi:clan AA aspartic protease (TIGR02281 family)